MIFEARYARNGRGAPEDVCPPLKAQSGETGKGDGAPLVFNALQDDKGEEGRDYSPPVQGSEKSGGALAVAGTVRSHVRPGSNASDEVLAAMPGDAELAEQLARDGHLPLVPYDPLPDGPRYAAMGDAVTVNVIEWIGVRLLDRVTSK